MPGFFLNRQDHAHQLIELIDAPNIKGQMDLCHCQIVEGDVATKLGLYMQTGRVAHLQIAGVPERHEPDIGELNYPYLLGVIDELSAQCGWQGWVGCEYRPKNGSQPGGTSGGAGLGQFAQKAVRKPYWRKTGLAGLQAAMHQSSNNERLFFFKFS